MAEIGRTSFCCQLTCWPASGAPCRAGTGMRRPVLGSILKPEPLAAAGSCAAGWASGSGLERPRSQASVAALLGGSWTGTMVTMRCACTVEACSAGTPAGNGGSFVREVWKLRPAHLHDMPLQGKLIREVWKLGPAHLHDMPAQGKLISGDSAARRQWQPYWEDSGLAP